MRRTTSQEVGEYDSRHDEDVFGQMIEARQSEIVTQGPGRFCRCLVEGVRRTEFHLHLLAIYCHVTARKIPFISTFTRRRPHPWRTREAGEARGVGQESTEHSRSRCQLLPHPSQFVSHILAICHVCSHHVSGAGRPSRDASAADLAVAVNLSNV